MNMQSIWPWIKRGMLAFGVFFLLLVVMDFSARMGELTHLSAQREIELAQYQQLQVTEQYLEEEIAYATSEAAVEEWARQEAHQAQQGDGVIVLLPDPDYTPAPPAPQIAELEGLSNWETWLAWFLGVNP